MINEAYDPPYEFKGYFIPLSEYIAELIKLKEKQGDLELLVEKHENEHKHKNATVMCLVTRFEIPHPLVVFTPE